MKKEAKNIENKNKMIKLFKNVMNDNDFKFYNYSPQEPKENSICFTTFNPYYSYKYEYLYKDLENSKYIKETKYNFYFKRGNHISKKTENVLISFDELPNLTISKEYVVKEDKRVVIEIEGKSIFTRNREIYKITNKLAMKQAKIKFGIFEFELSEKEFDELYEIAFEENKNREITQEQKSLNKRLKKYKK